MKSQLYEPVSGLEIHAQLLTKTNLFCSCSTKYGSDPNSLTCPVCLGLPGALPVLNREAVDMAIKKALEYEATRQLVNKLFKEILNGYKK